MDTGELIRSLTDELEQHTIEIRHEIHANPELSFHEFATSRIVCRELDRIGVPYEESPCKPGIIATIDSGKPGKYGAAGREPHRPDAPRPDRHPGPLSGHL